MSVACPDFVIPGEFRNLQVILENEGCVRTIFCAARASAHDFAPSRRSLRVFAFLHGCERFYRQEYFLINTGKCGFIGFLLISTKVMNVLVFILEKSNVVL